MGRAHSCALLTDGKIKCWGRDVYGQLGDGAITSSQTTPVEVSGLVLAFPPPTPTIKRHCHGTTTKHNIGVSMTPTIT